MLFLDGPCRLPLYSRSAMVHHPYAGANVLAYEGVVGVEGAFADGAQRALLFTLASSSLHRDSPYRRSCVITGLRFLMGQSLKIEL